jgi:hypothetical protein
MKKPALNVTNLLAATGALFAGYVFLATPSGGTALHPHQHHVSDGQ